MRIKQSNMFASPQKPQTLSAAWNNLGLVMKKNEYFSDSMVAYELAVNCITAIQHPTESEEMTGLQTIKNMMTLSLEMRHKNVPWTGQPLFSTGGGDTQLLMGRLSQCLVILFTPARTLPENKGYEYTLGIDNVPGHSRKLANMQVLHSSDRRPIRQYIYCFQRGVVEVEVGEVICVDC